MTRRNCPRCSTVTVKEPVNGELRCGSCGHHWREGGATELEGAIAFLAEARRLRASVQLQLSPDAGAGGVCIMSSCGVTVEMAADTDGELFDGAPKKFAAALRAVLEGS